MHSISQNVYFVILAFLSPNLTCQPPADPKPPEQGARRVLPRVTCTSQRIHAVFGPLVGPNLYIIDKTGKRVPVPKTKEHCGVQRGRSKSDDVSFFSRYDSCFVQVEDDMVKVSLEVQLIAEEQWDKVTLSCPLLPKKGLPSSTPPPSPLRECDIERALRVACGPQAVSADACLIMDCCYDAQDSTCYYRMNACSQDSHFVFWVRASDSDPRLNTSSLVVKDQPQCFPVVTTSDTAVFKVGMTDCGTKIKVEGDLIIYEVEVEELLTDASDRDARFSLQVQCQYEASPVQKHKYLQSLNPTNPPAVTALGMVQVQMRIATDESFTSFIPGEQLPLTVPLQKPVHVEVSIDTPFPNPNLSLRVRDCFAYPASRYSIWTLLYDGCPDPQDDMKSSVFESPVGNTTSQVQVRRFDVHTFAFLDPETGQLSSEEMFFYCWVEICPKDMKCEQRCSITSYDEEPQRKRREAESQQFQLLSFGPLLFAENTTEPE
ncbi:zona pellucida sperm-binding protein 1-like isoform X1 [Osmerus eperlanus]|uniref:zona pellucida sperm-binding protein 1-like isoform X1 n=1 Tax=Osmerus eperlanus TaxID=29151 RepID=UPI002E15C4E5